MVALRDGFPTFVTTGLIRLHFLLKSMHGCSIRISQSSTEAADPVTSMVATTLTSTILQEYCKPDKKLV